MKVVAGIDVGNSTTEIVLVRTARTDTEVVAAARAMTRGVKGSRESLEAAARLVLRTGAAHGVRVDTAAIASLHPVHTDVRVSKRPSPDTGPLRLIARGATTAAGNSTGVGRPVPVRLLDHHRGDPVVALVDAATPFGEAARAVNIALLEGVRVVAVVVERDEAVLVANRLHADLPIVDQVPVARLASARLVAVEARPQGQPLKQLTDTYWIASAFSLPRSRTQAQALARELQDTSYAVVALGPDAPPRSAPRPAGPDLVRWRDGSTSALPESVTRLRRSPPGTAVAVSSGPVWLPAADLYAVDLEDLAQQAHVRRGSIDAGKVVVAILDAADPSLTDGAGIVADALDTPVAITGTESEAGRLGALTTPGCPPDALVVDLGAGTVDVSEPSGQAVLAGAGEMLTRATAQALAVPSGTAEYAKRGAALLADSPQVVVDEKGVRTFLDAPLPGDSAGALCIRGPVGLLAVNRTLGLGEWRAWRSVAKKAIMGHNIRRGLAALDHHDALPLVIVGGGAGDDEVLAAVSQSLPPGSVAGRGDVAGSLGHRYAVAYGLAQLGVERI